MALSYPRSELGDDAVRLRRWRESDLGCIEEAAADPRIPWGTSVPVNYTAAEGLAFIHRQWGRAESGEGVSLAVADAPTDEAIGIGVLMLRPQEGVAGLGYWVIPRARGRGVATRIARLLTTWALTEAGVARVEAWVEPDNAASLRVLEGAGFIREGVLRSFLCYQGRRADAVVLSRIAEDSA